MLATKASAEYREEEGEIILKLDPALGKLVVLCIFYGKMHVINVDSYSTDAPKYPVFLIHLPTKCEVLPPLPILTEEEIER
jgi:hypothetical protein